MAYTPYGFASRRIYLYKPTSSLNASVTTSQGQKADAVAAPSIDATVTTAQGQMVFCVCDQPAFVRTAQGQKAAAVAYTSATVTTAQGQKVTAVASVPLIATVTTSQGQKCAAVVYNGLYPAGIDSAGYGTTRINYNPQVITNAGGVSPRTVGLHTVSYDGTTRIDTRQAQKVSATCKNNVLSPAGIDSAAYGLSRVQINKIRPIGLSSAAIGHPRIYHNLIQPSGIDSMALGTPQLGTLTQAVSPRGFDSSVVWYNYGPVSRADGRRAHIDHV